MNKCNDIRIKNNHRGKIVQNSSLTGLNSPEGTRSLPGDRKVQSTFFSEALYYF